MYDPVGRKADNVAAGMKSLARPGCSDFKVGVRWE